MIPRYQQTLELPAILARLAEHASFSAGKERALALAPSPDMDEVVHRQQETSEARHLLDIKPDLRLGGVHDLRPLVDAASRGARLLPHDLLNIRDTLDSTRRLKRSLLNLDDPLPHIADIAVRFDHCPELLSEIERCINDAGQVEDHASPTLARLRGELKVAYDRLMDRLNRILNNPKNARALQEGYITQRDGRYVIPIKNDFKSRIPGLVHDQSASGVTLFIEPMATVDLNNRWREIQLAEQHEVERILSVLSSLVAEQGEPVRATVEALADLDLALAKAKYSYTVRGIMPEIVPLRPRWKRRRRRGRDADNPSLARGDEMLHPGSVLELRQARHPLLDPRSVVPIDFHLTGDDHAVVITGPNTGGKTVALKTVGLLTLMAQCGLHLPADEGSRLTVFEQVCADIGDEQSIEQSLSTFSSHMTRIIEMLEDADERSLILLDELGAGTDPLEGAALAQSLLMELLGRQITVLATTHYAEVKVFAEQQPGIVNASVEFDVQTLAPTYRLTIGVPGQSNAFAIATGLGLPAHIVDRARDLVSADHLEAEQFLVRIKQTQAETAQARKEAQQANATAQKVAAELRERLANIEQERTQTINEARAQAAQELEAMRKELRALRRQMAILGAGGSPSRKSPSGAQDRDLADVESTLETLADRLAPPEPARPSPGELNVPGTAQQTIEVGDTVWVPALDATGEVLALEGSAAEIQMGAFRVRTRRAPLQLRRKGPAPTTAESEPRVVAPYAPPVRAELHLRGLRVDEAIPRLEKYVDDAYRAQAPFVRIVHGKGTGTLRKMVHQFLREHPFVSSYRLGEQGEGGTGVTVVKFVES